MASAVGTNDQFDFSALASRFTSSMTGKAPVPVPITSRWHFQGISSSIDKWRVSIGLAKLLGWLLLALADLAAVDHHIVFVRDAVYPDRTEGTLLEAHGDPPPVVYPRLFGGHASAEATAHEVSAAVKKSSSHSSAYR